MHGAVHTISTTPPSLPYRRGGELGGLPKRRKVFTNYSLLITNCSFCPSQTPPPNGTSSNLEGGVVGWHHKVGERPTLPLHKTGNACPSRPPARRGRRAQFRPPLPASPIVGEEYLGELPKHRKVFTNYSLLITICLVDPLHKKRGGSERSRPKVSNHGV